MPMSMPNPEQDSQSESGLPSGLRRRLGAELERARALLGWRGGRIHTGVHQARKSLRRARAVLALAGIAPERGPALIDGELRRICDGLSELRDAQALVEALDRMSATANDPDARALLRRARRFAAARRAAEARRALADDPGLARRRDRLAVLRAAVEGLPWSAVRGEGTAAALAHGVGRTHAAAARARDHGDDLDWHRWRRRARRLKQQRNVLAEAGFDLADFDAGAEPIRLSGLADALGLVQDFALLREHCGKGSPFAKADRKALKALAETGLAEGRVGLLRALEPAR